MFENETEQIRPGKRRSTRPGSVPAEEPGGMRRTAVHLLKGRRGLQGGAAEQDSFRQQKGVITMTQREMKTTATRRPALADGRYTEPAKREREKLSVPMALLLGILLTLEIMIGGAMVLNFDFKAADGIALGLSFMVLYFGVVALLTDR